MANATRNQALSELSLEVFRLTARLNALADRLSRQVGLSSARWQVMGTLALAGEPLPVAEIARRMGLQRQSVQRTADALADSGHLDYADNPRHRRAKLARLTDSGRQALTEIEELQNSWTDHVKQEFSLEELEDARSTLQTFRTLIDNND